MKKLIYILIVTFVSPALFAQKNDIPEKGRELVWNGSVKVDQTHIVPGSFNPLLGVNGPNGRSFLIQTDAQGNVVRGNDRTSSVDTFHVNSGAEVRLKLQLRNDFNYNYYFDRPVKVIQGNAVVLAENESCYTNSHGGEDCYYTGTWIINEYTELQFHEYSTSGQLSSLSRFKVVFVPEKSGGNDQPLPLTEEPSGKYLEVNDNGLHLIAEEEMLTELLVFDVQGHQLMSTSFEGALRMNALDLQTGLYFIVLSNQVGNKSFKIQLN